VVWDCGRRHRGAWLESRCALRQGSSWCGPEAIDLCKRTSRSFAPVGIHISEARPDRSYGAAGRVLLKWGRRFSAVSVVGAPSAWGRLVISTAIEGGGCHDGWVVEAWFAVVQGPSWHAVGQPARVGCLACF